MLNGINYLATLEYGTSKCDAEIHHEIIQMTVYTGWANMESFHPGGAKKDFR